MRKYVTSFLGAVMLVCGLAWAAGDMLSVQVKSGKLRSRPSFLGKVVGQMSYGQPVTLKEQKGSWVKIVGANGESGWLHESALSDEEITMKAGSEAVQVGASSEELALAGKGFNPTVENEYQKENPDLNYALIDRIETIVVTPEQAEAFLAAGQVEPNEGGR